METLLTVGSVLSLAIVESSCQRYFMPISDDSAWQLIRPVASFTKALLNQ